MNKTFYAAILVALLSACSSGVKLNDVPVEDKQASTVSTSVGNNAGATPSNNVATVDARQLGDLAAGPAGVGKLVYFDYDSYAIKPEFQNLLEKHAAYLKADGKRRAALEGHTDDRGGREYNLALGQKRAEAVRKALSLLGLPEAQIEAVSFGKEKPASTGGDEAAHAQNRRVAIAYK